MFIVCLRVCYVQHVQVNLLQGFCPGLVCQYFPFTRQCDLLFIPFTKPSTYAPRSRYLRCLEKWKYVKYLEIIKSDTCKQIYIIQFIIILQKILQLIMVFVSPTYITFKWSLMSRQLYVTYYVVFYFLPLYITRLQDIKVFWNQFYLYIFLHFKIGSL